MSDVRTRSMHLSPCADGGQHSWHFFKRLGFRFRQCKKCTRTEVKTISRRLGMHWNTAPNSMPF